MPPKGRSSKENPAQGKKKEKTNFKTLEGQSRLLAAVVASLDNARLDYKKIAQYLGGSATESSVEHRFRPVKAQAALLKALVAEGKDPSESEIWRCTKMSEIATLFGASTPDGVNFQFRSIKNAADAPKNAVREGERPVEAFNTHLNGSNKRARPVQGTAGATRRKKKVKIEPMSDDDEDLPEVNFSDLDMTPSSVPEPIVGNATSQPELPNGYTDLSNGFGSVVLLATQESTSAAANTTLDINSINEGMTGNRDLVTTDASLMLNDTGIHTHSSVTCLAPSTSSVSQSGRPPQPTAPSSTIGASSKDEDMTRNDTSFKGFEKKEPPSFTSFSDTAPRGASGNAHANANSSRSAGH